jgi:hypothetical protein
MYPSFERLKRRRIPPYAVIVTETGNRKTQRAVREAHQNSRFGLA